MLTARIPEPSMGSHDANYKRLFSHPRMMEDFLRAFVRESWVADLDFSTLENLGSDFVTDEGELRDGDVVWSPVPRDLALCLCAPRVSVHRGFQDGPADDGLRGAPLPEAYPSGVD
jgi:hypothetical protein